MSEMFDYNPWQQQITLTPYQQLYQQQAPCCVSSKHLDLRIKIRKFREWLIRCGSILSLKEFDRLFPWAIPCPEPNPEEKYTKIGQEW